jgi:hypothetical protein
MGHLGEVDGYAQLARENGDSLHVILMLMRNENGIERVGILTRRAQTLQNLAAGETRIDQNAGATGGDDGAVSLRTARQHRHTHHWKSIRQS